jgi:hypothetical protein
MHRTLTLLILASGTLAVLGTTPCFAGPGDAKPLSLVPAELPRVGAIDERFQSYNIEMVEVTGGRFWKPYASKAETKQPDANQPAGMDPSLYEYRQPIDLSTPRLRKLAAALGPAFVRVSGTWANSTFFQNSDEPAPATPPKGFKGVLTRAQWKGVVDFSNAVDARLVTSFAVSDGVRDAAGVWTPDQAKQILDYTKSVGGNIVAAEFMNEPTFPEMGGAPKGYDAAAFGRDFAIFHTFIKQAAPNMYILGPGGVGEGSALLPASMHPLTTGALLSVTGPVFDGFSYHTYGAVSSRCAAMGADGTTTAAAALTEDWLGRGAANETYYAGIRDILDPGKRMWLTETAQAACGGDRWASSFVDTFRYLNQLGAVAKAGVQAHMHNTLAASDYGLLDEKTYAPRPDYWAALLWRRLMGTTVLDAGDSPSPSLHLYAHCLRNQKEGVALLAINASQTEAQTLDIPSASEAYTLTAQDLMGAEVRLNGNPLNLGADDALPELKGTPTRSGKITFAPESITFLALPKAKNQNCRQ